MWPAQEKDDNHASSEDELHIAAMNMKTVNLKVNMTAIISISTLTHKPLFPETILEELQEKPQNRRQIDEECCSHISQRSIFL